MTLVSLPKCCDILSAGGKSEKAETLFQEMKARRCKPDASAYHAVLLAHIRAGHWRAALQVSHPEKKTRKHYWNKGVASREVFSAPTSRHNHQRLEGLETKWTRFPANPLCHACHRVVRCCVEALSSSLSCKKARQF